MTEQNAINLADSKDYENHMQSVFGDEEMAKQPILKFKDKKIVYKLGEEEKEFTKIDWVRVIYKTHMYQLSTIVDDKIQTLGSSNEFLRNKPFTWYDGKTKTKHTFNTGRELREHLWELTEWLKLTYLSIVYFELPEYGIIKSYLKLSKTNGVRFEDNKTLYLFDEPLADSIGEKEKSYKGKISDYLFTLSAKDYKYKIINICYPTFTNDEMKLDPAIISKTLGIMNELTRANRQRSDTFNADTTGVVQDVEVISGDSDELPF